jgi:hypothetical protein
MLHLPSLRTVVAVAGCTSIQNASKLRHTTPGTGLRKPVLLEAADGEDNGSLVTR